MATILLVEDSADLTRLLMRELREGGHEAIHASDGATALELIEQSLPELIVLDWMLPVVDGLEVLRRLRQTSAVPVLMLTARAEEVDRVVGLELGADDYLTKPFSPRELLARIRALLRRDEWLRQTMASDRQREEAAVVYGPLRLDPAAHQATMNGAAIELTRTEFALLHLLVRQPGRTFNRSYLLDAVWGDDFGGSDRSVDNTILRLRRKLEPLQEAIETVWGIGYRLRQEP